MFGLALAAGSLALLPHPEASYVAHEWGTFTSVQRSDGELLEWHPLASSQLPGFVHNWHTAGYGRWCTSPLGNIKGEISTLQRMETPVIYFYSALPQKVDIEVRFPKGLITEWYPQAAKIGPSSTQHPWLISKLDDGAHKVGANPNFTFASWLSTPASPKSVACWDQVEILGNQPNEPAVLPRDASGSHYFSARDTDASLLSVPLTKETNTGTESERFIFYRGVANFETPLRVMAEPTGGWCLWNRGSEPLKDLFLVSVQQGQGHFRHVNGLASGQSLNVRGGAEEAALPLERMADSLGAAMKSALERHGLYTREAAAMVQTWRNSWFQEEGTRVLYVLPRAWTDQVLPLRLNPAPAELTRVMVGRAEVFSPQLEQRLTAELSAWPRRDSAVEKQIVSDLKSLGRFAEPAVQFAVKGATEEAKQRAWELLHLASVSPADQER